MKFVDISLVSFPQHFYRFIFEPCRVSFLSHRAHLGFIKAMGNQPLRPSIVCCSNLARMVIAACPKVFSKIANYEEMVTGYTRDDSSREDTPDFPVISLMAHLCFLALKNDSFSNRARCHGQCSQDRYQSHSSPGMIHKFISRRP